jgi:uncharacterized protein YecA (UPF0149 family)
MLRRKASVIAALGALAAGSNLDQDQRRRVSTPRGAARPVLPRGGVGRNDPCPCGSGRKYKACCRTTGEEG